MKIVYNDNMVVKYDIETDKTDGQKRLCFLSDLHGQCPAGTVEKTEELSPHAVVLGGDLFDRKADNTPAFNLVCELISRFECVFSPGNHDTTDKNRKLLGELEKRGLRLLDKGKSALISGISFSGISDPSQFLCAAHNLRPRVFNVLIDHVPDNAENYPTDIFDLILSGHEHGGFVKIGKINGLIGHSGFFPAHAGGVYHYGKIEQIVSRGLCEGKIPRIGISPELVLINIRGKKQ